MTASPSGPSAHAAPADPTADVLDRADLYAAGVDAQLDALLDQHRALLAASLDGLTEEEARRSLVPSKTTLLGLVKHAAFVERVWFEEARTGRSRAELGLVATPDDSFDLHDDDTVASVLAAHRAACEASRAAVRADGHDAVWSGNRRGPLPVRFILLHVVRELAQHCGHAEILREQVLAAR